MKIYYFVKKMNIFLIKIIMNRAHRINEYHEIRLLIERSKTYCGCPIDHKKVVYKATNISFETYHFDVKLECEIKFYARDVDFTDGVGSYPKEQFLSFFR
jgi:hypothetical protein